MKIILISDTHGQHKKLAEISGDLIIHAGDVSIRGTYEEVSDFLNWYKSLDFKYKVFIAGNHDFYFEGLSETELKKLIPENVIYLNDSGITIEDLKIWGSPIQPWFFDWAFNRQRGEEIKKHWDLIPTDIDILVTHGPPVNILDKTLSDEHVGCEDLLNRVKVVEPRIHVFGHIHEAYGIQKIDVTKFINASVLNLNYEMSNSPIELDFVKFKSR